MRDGARLNRLKKIVGLLSGSPEQGNNAAENILKKKAEHAEALEGQIREKEARFRVRNHKLIQIKKAGSDYCCEVCGFNFAKIYGETGRKFIIAHHIEPLGLRHRPSMTGLEDLALICSNCHAMLHTGHPSISLNELRSLASVRKFRDSFFE
jgi:predicted HNH restriction endonuclease